MPTAISVDFSGQPLITMWSTALWSAFGAAKRSPRQAIGSFFDEILSRSLNDNEHKGCMLVNSALEIAPHDREFQKSIANVLGRIETFFLHCINAGQADGTVTLSQSAEILAQHLLGVLMGVRVLARVRPERALLEGVVAPALALIAPSDGKSV